ncbi:hypothetical protein NQ317_016120 [Molorchus minor]|uniref:Uncharacterized protein n=1 Tax=Molorchus minor TaxID=1323400 RepID=A0ABQ9JN68_9CUCU|nr:hypothetical protein NQ317_016120 [Molorchus minor]
MGPSTSTGRTHNTQNKKDVPQQTSSQLDLLRLSPLTMGFSPNGSILNGNTSSKLEMPLIHGEGHIIGRYPFNSPTESNSGLMDPLFCCEPFVPLEPVTQSDYNFSLDATEGLADLFDYDFLS